MGTRLNGFDEWFEQEWKDYRGKIGTFKTVQENCAEAWTAARADRQELVACVLEMAERFENNNKYDVEFHGAIQGFIRSHPMRKYEDLITKLKAEKDTL